MDHKQFIELIYCSKDEKLEKMGLRDSLNDDGAEWNKDNSYIDNLISLFISNPTVKKAYFGLVYNGEGEGDLFLAVEQDDESNEVQRMVEMVTQMFSIKRQVFFTSNSFLPEWLEHITQYNFPFYVKGEFRYLNVAIMKYWFNQDLYKTDLIHEIKTGTVISLFKDFDPFGNSIIFQTYVREGREFIPLFSEKDMIYKSGMKEVPEDLTVMEFDWMKVDKVVEGNLREHLYVLNPGTSFEIELIT